MFGFSLVGAVWVSRVPGSVKGVWDRLGVTLGFPFGPSGRLKDKFCQVPLCGTRRAYHYFFLQLVCVWVPFTRISLRLSSSSCRWYTCQFFAFLLDLVSCDDLAGAFCGEVECIPVAYNPCFSGPVEDCLTHLAWTTRNTVRVASARCSCRLSRRPSSTTRRLSPACRSAPPVLRKAKEGSHKAAIRFPL